MNAKKRIMKRSTIGNIFAIAAVTALALGPSAHSEGRRTKDALTPP